MLLAFTKALLQQVGNFDTTNQSAKISNEYIVNNLKDLPLHTELMMK